MPPNATDLLAWVLPSLSQHTFEKYTMDFNSFNGTNEKEDKGDMKQPTDSVSPLKVAD
jgi:hypothetical protein